MSLNLDCFCKQLYCRCLISINCTSVELIQELMVWQLSWGILKYFFLGKSKNIVSSFYCSLWKSDMVSIIFIFFFQRTQGFEVALTAAYSELLQTEIELFAKTVNSLNLIVVMKSSILDVCSGLSTPLVDIMLFQYKTSIFIHFYFI